MEVCVVVPVGDSISVGVRDAVGGTGAGVGLGEGAVREKVSFGRVENADPRQLTNSSAAIISHTFRFVGMG